MSSIRYIIIVIIVCNNRLRQLTFLKDITTIYILVCYFDNIVSRINIEMFPSDMSRLQSIPSLIIYSLQYLKNNKETGLYFVK